MTTSPRVGGLCALLLVAGASAHAQAPSRSPAASAAAPAATRASALNAELFYQLLLAELSTRAADAGTGFSLLLDAARKTGDAALYQRATEIALQARSGESALQAARAWRQAHPTSREATRFVLQILLALNRVADTAEPLRAQIAQSSAAERSAVLALVPRLYARASDKKLAATVVEQALAESLAQAETAAAAWTAVGRLRLAAADPAGALEAATRAQAAGPANEGPVLLALELIAPQRPQAEALVRRYLEGPQPAPEIRMNYTRALLDAQRYADARVQLQVILSQRADFAEAWLLQGVLQVQDNQPEAGEASLRRYVELAQARPRAETGDDGRGLVQAYLALAQIAEKRGDLAQANAWLDRIQNPQDMVAAQGRRASILARQGRMDEARALIRALPERNEAQGRAKLLAEAHLLRDHRQYQGAYDILGQAVGRLPADTDLLYEQAMMADKLARYEDMERLLRQALAIKPDFHHAYNALGYSLAERGVRLPEAKQLIQKALEFAPEDPYITDSLGWVEFRLGNRAEAQRLLEKAYRARPDAEIAAHLGEVLWSLGQRDRAQAIWREGLLLNRENDTLQETLRRFRVKP